MKSKKLKKKSCFQDFFDVFGKKIKKKSKTCVDILYTSIFIYKHFKEKSNIFPDIEMASLYIMYILNKKRNSKIKTIVLEKMISIVYLFLIFLKSRLSFFGGESGNPCKL